MRGRQLSLIAAAVGIALVLPQGAPVRAADVGSPSPPPAPRALPTSVFTKAATVRLITGDRVRVLSRADGSTASTILPGSPHADGPVVRWQTPTQSFLLPQTAPSVRRRLDPSLFDVTALARYGGRVPIVVHFERRDTVHRLPGVTLARSARSTSTTRVVRGSYSSATHGLTAHDLAGVSSIRLAAAPAPPARSATTHRVAVQVLDAGGHLAAGVEISLENVDDGTALQDTTGAGGRVHFDVPDGPYSVLGFSSSRLVIAPELEVTADQTVDLDLGDATVKPQVGLAGYHVLDATLSVARTAENGLTFPFDFIGPHFGMRIQPTAPQVAHGALGTGVSATLAPLGVGGSDVVDRVAVTADVSRGVPDDLTYTHHLRDFAKVIDTDHANGPSGARETFLGAFASLPNGFLDLFSANEYLTSVPGRRVVLFEATPRVFYQQTLMPQAPTQLSNDVTQLSYVARYPHAGSTQRLSFAHGPVGPGLRAHVSPRAATLLRHRLFVDLPLFAGSGSSMFGWVDGRDGSWSLRGGGRILAHGRHEIELNTRVPVARSGYVLTATSAPVSPTWTLSTHVEDRWAFRAGGEVPVAPLLLPDYLPPTSVTGSLRAGRTTFPLVFHSLARHNRRVVSAQLQLSTDDGRTWQDAHLTRTSPTKFRVEYLNPRAHGAERFMSLRVVAKDDTGSSVTETALRVYSLR